MENFPLYAHTPNAVGNWHLLSDHLLATAERAEAFADIFGAGEAARTAGWLHDVGKCSTTFAAYLQTCAREGSVAGKSAFTSRDHKSAGALRASGLPGNMSWLTAGTILGHHGGLLDLAEVRSKIHLIKSNAQIAETLRRLDRRIGHSPFPLSCRVPEWAQEQPTPITDVEMLWRLIFSALVDADFLDTEAHFNKFSPGLRRADQTLAGLKERFEARRSKNLSSSPDTPVNRARTEIYQTVLARAGQRPGLYMLAAPTGSGKTQIGLGWALAHAQANNLRRIVCAVPFITVTDQVAQVYRDLLEYGNAPVVLEHHSQVVEDSGWQRLASENWDSAVTVTTTVRLFESLFSNRTSDCRRLHRLAGSVLVLDEAQAIPIEVLNPVVDGLRALVDRFGASILIMTATQPALEHLEPTKGRQAIDILPEVGQWKEAFERTTIELTGRPPELTPEELAKTIVTNRQCLCILNTIGDARRVTLATADKSVIHLSTMLRPCDRLNKLIEIRRRLSRGEPCRVVSTQLVEAGVDLDFPVVLRAMAPLPSLAQADGRCNRNGALGPGGGRMIVFDLVDGVLPLGSYYKVGTPHSHTIMRSLPDFRSAEAVASWYERLLKDPAVIKDSGKVQASRMKFKYQTTANSFRMIDDDTIGVAVTKGHPNRRSFDQMLDNLRNNKHVDRAQLREIQQITVSLRRRVADKALQLGLSERINDYLHRWLGSYDQQLGLVLEASPQSELIW